jgi:hypothetical protein
MHSTLWPWLNPIHPTVLILVDSTEFIAHSVESGQVQKYGQCEINTALFLFTVQKNCP